MNRRRFFGAAAAACIGAIIPWKSVITPISDPIREAWLKRLRYYEQYSRDNPPKAPDNIWAVNPSFFGPSNGRYRRIKTTEFMKVGDYLVPDERVPDGEVAVFKGDKRRGGVTLHPAPRREK